ncbi:MAG: hypothetical protein WBM69_13375 [Desulfobacterales bacterium]
MTFYRVIISLLIILGLGTSWAANDIQQGIHGMKWGSSVSAYDELTKVHETDQATYYANSNMVYQSANQPVPGVFYGFYRDQLFAVFIKLRSADQYAQLERQFTAKHGKPKTTYYPETRQTVHRWEDADVKIKLKMKESPQEFKMAIYHAPLAAILNQEQLESIPSDVYDKTSSKQEPTVKSKPLLD